MSTNVTPATAYLTPEKLRLIGKWALLVLAAWLAYRLLGLIGVTVLVFIVWRTMRKSGGRVHPAQHAVFHATAKLMGIQTELYDRKNKIRRLVPASQWVQLVKGGGVICRFPYTFEATPANVARVTEQVERVLSGRFDVTVEHARLVFSPMQPLPTRAEFEPLRDVTKLAYGKTLRGTAVWDVVAAPHGLVSGATGSGKTVAMRALIVSALMNSWHVVGCDPKRIELSWLRGRKNAEVFSTLDEMHAAITRVHDEMMRRFDSMDAGEKMTSPYLLLVVDEATSLLAQAAKMDTVTKLSNIARLGRRARVHLLLGMQRPDAKNEGGGGLPGELKRNLDFRLAVGPHDAVASKMILDVNEAQKIEPVKGRGVSKTLGQFIDVQCMFIADPFDVPTALDAWLPRPVPQAAAAPLADEPTSAPVSPEVPEVVAQDGAQDAPAPVVSTRRRRPAAAPVEAVDDQDGQSDRPEDSGPESAA